MKKSRLLEIIREEIAGALNEAGLYNLKNPSIDAKKGLPQTIDPDDATEKSPDFLRKYKKVSEIELEEDLLNEKPDFGGRFDQQVAAKYGEEDTLETAMEKVVNKTLSDKGISKADVSKMDKEGLKDLLKSIRQQISGKGQTSDVSKALKKQTEFDNSGSKLQDNQTNNAILKALGLITPKSRGRKADPNKPKAEPKEPGVRGRKPMDSKPKSPTTDMDDEEKEAAKAAGSDSTAKALGKMVPADKIEKFNLGLKFIKKYKDDKAKIDAYLKKASSEYKLPASMIKDLKKAAGREVGI